MSTVVSLICIGGCALGMLLVATLLMQEHRSHANLLLAYLVGVASLEELCSAVEHLSRAFTGSMVRLTGFPGLLFAPLLYLYFRAQHRALRARPNDAWHFTFFVALQALALVDLLVPGAFPAAVLRPGLNLACLLIIGFYALASMRMVGVGVLPRRCSLFHSCKVAMLALMVALASYLMRAAAGMPAAATELGGDLSDAVLCVALAVLTGSAVLRALSREPVEVEQGIVPAPEATSESEKKYGNNRLPDFARESMVAELRRHMQAAEPWLKTDLTLAQLAAGINVAPHHLSQIINSEFGKSFACYINEYRVRAACHCLSRDSGKSVLDIALDSGFASKSSFNALFKKHTGMTPSEYRKKFHKQNSLVA